MDKELAFYIVLLVVSLLWMGINIIKHNRNNSYVSDGWTSRHIDSNGNYRAQHMAAKAACQGRWQGMHSIRQE